MKKEFFACFSPSGANHHNPEWSFSQFSAEPNIEDDDSLEKSLQYGLLQSHYEDFISSYVLAERQNEVFHELLKRLLYGCECPSSLLSKLELSFSDEEGVIIHRVSKQGVSFIAIDDEGDSMFSFSSYTDVRKGRRMFFDYGSGSEEAMAYRLLAE